MFPFMNILAALPWRLIAALVLAFVLFIGGCQYGENRVTSKWGAEKAATAKVVTKQAERVATATTQQSTINQEISNEFQKAKTAIVADRPHLLALVPERVRVDTTDSASAVPVVPVIAAGVDAATADAVPAVEQPVNNAACQKLVPKISRGCGTDNADGG